MFPRILFSLEWKKEALTDDKNVCQEDEDEFSLDCRARSSPGAADNDLKPGAHITAIGSYKPHIREIPGETVLRAKVVVDHRASCLSEAGDLLIPLQEGRINEDQIYAEIGELVTGDKPGRTSESEVTLYKSVGNAVQDLVTASAVLEKANALNLGVEVSL